LRVNRPNGNGTTVQDSPIIETAHSPKTTPAIELLRIDATKVDRLMDLVGELIISRSMLSEIQTQLKREFPKHTQVSRLSDIDSYLGRILAEMQKAVMQVRMVSLDQIFNRFFRVVRDLAHDRNKQIQLETVGEETELDKRVVDTIYEPLLHLVRNAVDHGIEDEQTRQAAGKPVRGHILLKAYYQGDQVVIEVEDDGCGIDIERLKAKAVERKLISPYEINTLQGQSALELIFLSGLSTAERVSEVSGRGVGMDVVKNVLDSLKGSIEINSEIGRGTRFTLRLPLTLAIIRTMLFKIEDRVLALPLANVIEIVRAPHQQLQQIGNHKVYNLRDTFYSLIELDKLLLQRSSRKSIDNPFILLVGMGERRMGLIADSVIGEQEIVVKAVDKNWISSDLVTGASILGDGQIVLILDTNALLRRVTTLTRSATAER
jgi:two-component system chemotaxis sensor kinase CheA